MNRATPDCRRSLVQRSLVRRSSRFIRMWAGASAVGLVLVACGADTNDVATADATRSSASTTTDAANVAEQPGSEPPVSEPPVSEPVVTEPPVSEVLTEPILTAIETAAPVGVSVTVELGYPRDLLERGRVNVVTKNGSDVDLLISARELVVDGFVSPGAEQRPTTVPAGRNRMALQTLFGDVADCSEANSVKASMVITYTTSDDDTVRRSALPVGDTSILNDIRAQTCTARHVLDFVHITFDNVVVDGESMNADAVFERVTGDESYEITAIVGTVIFGAESVLPVDDVPRVFAADQQTFVLPLVFDVNRCDSHAVAETTKKFGLDLWISVDGAIERRVPIDLDPLLDDFETMLERCKARTGQ